MEELQKQLTLVEEPRIEKNPPDFVGFPAVSEMIKGAAYLCGCRLTKLIGNRP